MVAAASVARRSGDFRLTGAKVRCGAGRAIPGAKAEWPRRVDLTRELGATPTAIHGCIPVIRDHGLGPGQPPCGRLDRGDGYEGGPGLGEVFEVLGQVTISAEL